MAIEINEESINHLLAAKVKTPQTVRPQILPEFCFCWCGLLPQLLCWRQFFRWPLACYNRLPGFVLFHEHQCPP